MIDLYSTNCPKCQVLKKKLDEAKIEYTLHEDKDEVVAKGRELKIMGAPFMVVDGKPYTFTEANKFISESIPTDGDCDSCKF